jgi:hypothetical protein
VGFKAGDQVMLPDGNVGTIISGISNNLTESDAEDLLVVAVTENGVERQKLVKSSELMENLR